MNKLYKILASRMPIRWQQGIKRVYYGHQIKQDRFTTDEKEFGLLAHWIGAGDKVIDIGANIGHYTCRLSSLVGPEGRVFAFEPVPHTFEILASNVALLGTSNITLFNVAASESNAVHAMEMPRFDTGLDNYYQAHITDKGNGLRVFCIAIDNLQLPGPIKLVKIDAEGHELPVLKGLRNLLARDYPVLVIEDNSPEIARYLDAFGYVPEKIDGSCNIVFTRE